ncbi:hypothetical protein [Halorhodospira halochloris]|uniref:hypothetical protein n=1 Tax=Halorhodospira halochloris TaxID=1052 RepID=UPI001EE7F471|nr:hypothetical protein [Halorhodospira halochloris]MCG5547981.1 hypothetical protein [Halorhodospira halochloris]
MPSTEAVLAYWRNAPPDIAAQFGRQALPLRYRLSYEKLREQIDQSEQTVRCRVSGGQSRSAATEEAAERFIASLHSKTTDVPE